MAIHKKYKLGKEAREALLAGAKVVYDLVSPTSGPKGRNIAYARPWGLPRIINDGIEIAKEVGSEDDFLNVGIDLIREAAQNTVTEAGDGTTTATILAFHILKAGIEAIDNGENPMVLRKQIMDCLASLLKVIPTLSTKIKSEAELKKVALISSSYDEEIAEVVSHAVWEMGIDGIVTTEEGNGTTITSEITKGLQIAKGYLDPMFVTDPMRMESVIVNPAVLVFDKPISFQNELVPIMDLIIKTNKNLVIFGDIRSEALINLVINKQRGVINILAVNPPGYAEQRLAGLEDIAILTGATVINSATKEFRIDMLGSASHVTANKTTTTITGGKGSKLLLDERIKELRAKKDSADNSLYQKEVYEERLSKLSAGVALIKVGAKSETLKREKFEKVKDAIGASKAALAEGIVVGGGMAFIELANHLLITGDNIGSKVLYDALFEPTRKLLLNAGKEELERENIIKKLTSEKEGYGFNVNTDKVEDLMKAGVIDPIRVIRLALENAVVVATSMLTSEGIIIESDKDKKLGQ